ncbi:MAG: NERD domain-containing protein [Gammaproteobacteria bacterium]|nr:NERD domain-containing protein [Gammaproteobacteria bacterium]
MVQFFPTRSSARFDTPGERRLAERLAAKLKDDYLCWCNVPVGPKALQPDFVILHPQRGFLVLEVKDWKLDTIHTMDRGIAQLFDGRQLKSVKNPMTQGRAYAMEVSVALQRDPALKHPPGSPHPGNLLMPYGWGVVLTHITRKQFRDETNLAEVLESQWVIFQDEMTEGVDAEAFQQWLSDIFPHVFSCKLSRPQIDRVRHHLYPEVRINAASGQFGLFADEAASLPNLVRVMDFQQELLARSMGDGHRVIHGAAGAGKTVILGYRAAQIAASTSKPVLVLCYNRTLASRLRQVVNVRGLVTGCGALLPRPVPRSNGGLSVPPPAASVPVGEMMVHIGGRTRAGVNRGQITHGQYAALMIEEGHDFQPE